MPTALFKLRCRYCNQPVSWPPVTSRCPRPSCRGPLQPKRNIIFDVSLIEPSLHGMWRYRHMLPPLPVHPVTLGEGGTPLLAVEDPHAHLFLKNESLNPTGSFKDRGAALLINTIGDARVVIDDSSGNAGAALAAYAARAGVIARIYAPQNAPQAKIGQMLRYGAQVVLVPGNRDDVRAAAEKMCAEEGVFYASHAHHPGYSLAMQTIAWEIWEQLGRRAPDAVIMPAGNGSLLRGVRWGFRSLQKGKAISDLPRLFAVQAENCAPLLAYSRGDYRRNEFRCQPTLADGVAIPNPPLLDAMWAAVRKTKGKVITAPEEAILSARDALASMGFFVEPTAALPYAAWLRIRDAFDPDETVVLLLTGHGFKTV